MQVFLPPLTPEIKSIGIKLDFKQMLTPLWIQQSVTYVTYCNSLSFFVYTNYDSWILFTAHENTPHSVMSWYIKKQDVVIK